MPGAGASMFLMLPFDRAPMFVGRGRGRDSFETMAEMMVHDHFRRWCAAGGCSYARKEAPRAVPPLPRSAKVCGGVSGRTVAGSRVPGFARSSPGGPGKTGGEIGADAPGRGQTGGKGRFSVARGSVVVTDYRYTMLTFYHATAGPNYAHTPSR